MLVRLLPKGTLWQVNTDKTIYKLFLGASQELQRVHVRALDLLNEMDPRTSVELLSDWERVLGLPDPCAGQAPTLAARQTQAFTRFKGDGGQSKRFIIDFAANLGFTVTISNYQDFRVGRARAGDRLTNVTWPFAFRVNAPLNTVTQFVAGKGSAGEPLADWGNDVLECEIKRIAHSHTIPVFSYS